MLRCLEADETYRKEYARLMDVLFYVSQADSADTGGHAGAIDEIFRRTGTVGKNTVKYLKFRPFYKYAAALLFMIMSVVLVRYYNYPPEDTRLAQHVVPDGGRERIMLPDSSVVWINGGTTVRYAEDFGVRERWVELDGEAYFEVVRRPGVPFIVDMKDFQIQVFGTKFNVSSYNDEERAETVLDEGHIGISLKSGDRHFIDLHPREKAVFDRREQKLTKAAASGGRSWKDGFLVFDKDNFDAVARKMEHRYGVKITVEKVNNNNYLYTGTFTAESLKDVLDAIDFLTPIKYTVNTGEVLISFE